MTTATVAASAAPESSNGRRSGTSSFGIASASSVRREEKLPEILLASLRQLAAAGDVDGACRLAGRACVALRKEDPGAEHHFNALLHRLSSQLSW